MTQGVDVAPAGIVVGHATDVEGATGCTVVRAPQGALRVGGVQLGRATGSREFALATPHHAVDRIDAILLTGGSAYGLDAAAGVMRWMEERARGFAIGGGVVPLVPAAVIFDLAPLGSFTSRPTPAMAHAACEAAVASPAEGSVGAGTGATVGKAAGAQHAMKGGVGVWIARAGEIVVAAVAVTNAFGDVRDASGAIIAGARGDHGTFLDATKLLTAGVRRDGAGTLNHTTLAVVATNAMSTRVELQQLASASTAAFHRRITPCGTSFDGDTIFALGPETGGPTAARVTVETLAVQALEMAIERSVRLARGRDGIPGLAD